MTRSGAKTRARRRPSRWVTKSALMRWQRCPYAGWLVDRGMIAQDALITPDLREVMDLGVAFEREVEAADPSRRILPGRLAEVIEASPSARVGQYLTENEALGLRGQVDVIEVAGGALYPCETKAHARVRASDRLELAFYWRLLAPWRTRDVKPEGIVNLLRAGERMTQRVAILPRNFEQLDGLIASIRAGRTSEVPPHACRRCAVCTGLIAEPARVGSVLPVQPSELTRVDGVSPARARELERLCAISTLEQLAGSDPAEVAATLQSGGVVASDGEVWRWRMHAVALHRVLPARASPMDPFPVGEDFVALDLEYESESCFVWTAGVCVVRRGGRLVEQRWAAAGDTGAERAAIAWLVEFVDEHPDLPVVTWYGRCADMVTLRKVADHHGIDVAAVLDRHVDPAVWMRGNLRLPVAGAGLKQLTRFFGLNRVSTIRNGLQATASWRRASTTGDAVLRDQLLAYNRDDLHGLVSLVEALRGVAGSDEVVLVDRPPDWPPVPRRRSPSRRWWEDPEIPTVTIDPTLLAGLARPARQADVDSRRIEPVDSGPQR